MDKLRALEEMDVSIRLVLGDFWFSSLVDFAVVGFGAACAAVG